jgi:hypothetical protein
LLEPFYPVYSLTPTEYKTNYSGLENFESIDPKNHFPRMYTRALISSIPLAFLNNINATCQINAKDVHRGTSVQDA